MIYLRRLILRMLGRAEVPRDPAVIAVATTSTARARETHRLLVQVRSRISPARLERARMKYNERLHGTRKHRPA